MPLAAPYLHLTFLVHPKFYDVRGESRIVWDA